MEVDEALEASGAPRPRITVDEQRLGRSVLRLAWPVIVERFSISLLAAVDGVLVGRYVGDDGLAAVGLATMVFGIPQTGIIGLELGTTTAVSWDYGRGDQRRLTETLRTAISMALIWGVVVALLAAVFAGPALRLMGLEPDVRAEGVAFMQRAAPGLVGLAAFGACAGALRGMGNSRFALYIVLMINVLNAAITWLLISGVVGIELGTAAGGWGFGISGLLAGAVSLAMVASGYNGLRLRPAHLFGLSLSAVRRLLDLAIPVALEEAQFLAAFLAYARIIASLGTAATAAHTVALRSTDLAIVAVFGLGTAATALVGQALGAGRPDLGERISHAAQRYGVISMCVLAVVQLVAAPYIAGLFTNDQDVVDEAVKALRVFALGVPALGLYATVSGSLRGAGDVRFVLLILTVTAWGVRIPMAYVGAHVIGWGLAGAWAGAVLEVNARAALNVMRFRAGHWKRRQV